MSKEPDGLGFGPSMGYSCGMKRVGDEASRWSVFLLRKKAERIGSVLAKSKEDALKRAMEECVVEPRERFRLSVQKDAR